LSTRPDARIALVFRGDRRLRDTCDLARTRLAPVAAALNDVGLAVEPSVFGEDMADEVRDQLLDVDGVLIWVDPVTGTADRTVLDALLREVAASGVWVSAHPDVILKMGTKEVLHRTRSLGWGVDTALYRNQAELAEGLRLRLAEGPRVLKQYRGNGGIGVWKVELADRATVRVQSARMRDDAVEVMPLAELLERCAKYFTYAGGEGRLVDQPFQTRINEGIVRAYLVGRDVVGFCRQYPADPHSNHVFGLPSEKTMFGPAEPMFDALRRRLEREWVSGLQHLVEVDDASLPALWDADFLYGATDERGEDTYVLGEINVSAVAPFPSHAVQPLAQRVLMAVSGWAPG
jgi:hypothetical protein